MRLTPTCLACILATRAAEIERVVSDPAEGIAVFRDVVNTVSLYTGPHIELALTATMSYRRLKSSISSPYPRDMREQLYKQSLEAAKSVKDVIESAESPGDALRLALIAAALASRLQPGPHMFTEKPMPPTSVEVIGARIGRDDTDEFLKKVRNGMTVFYVTGSISELPYDEILMEVLGDEYGAKIVAVVRGGEFQDFVHIGDLEYTNLEKVADSILNLGSDVATIIKEETTHFYERLREADIVIVKGLLQTLHVHNNLLPSDTLALFYAPCRLAEKVLGVPLNTANILLISKSKEG